MKTRPRLDTKENREFWRFVAECQKRVEAMPSWMKGEPEHAGETGEKKDSDSPQ